MGLIGIRYCSLFSLRRRRRGSIVVCDVDVVRVLNAGQEKDLRALSAEMIASLSQG